MRWHPGFRTPRITKGGAVLMLVGSGGDVAVYDSLLRDRHVVAGGPQRVGLVPFVGDSSLLFDIPNQSTLVLAPDGTVRRTLDIPHLIDFATLTSDGLGSVLWSRPRIIPNFDRSGAVTDSSRRLLASICSRGSRR